MNPKTRPEQRLDGQWLAYVRGLPLMRPDFSNLVFPTRDAALAAIDAATVRNP
jgi:hypothetical protein